MRIREPKHRLAVGLALIWLAPALSAAEETAAERGRDFVLQRPLNPPIWSMRAYDDAWKQWGLKLKPADYASAFRERYGLVAAPKGNHGLPLGLVQAPRLLGKGVTNNCLLCHAGRVAGQTIIGVGNASLDLQSLFEDMSAAADFPLKVPFQFSYVRGTIDPVSPIAYLMQFRNPDLNSQKPVTLDLSADIDTALDGKCVESAERGEGAALRLEADADRRGLAGGSVVDAHVNGMQTCAHW